MILFGSLFGSAQLLGFVVQNTREVKLQFGRLKYTLSIRYLFEIWNLVYVVDILQFTSPLFE